ncbi:MAG: haloacid dehalogenase-like hydrolase [Clostridia bacterium]|nr:haloacid dehalogenase-like hydrolase [Clostridia bacterium]
MIIIYDFDGTLTPYSLPQYEIIQKCGYTDEMLMKRIYEEMQKESTIGLYNAFYKCYRDILTENGFEMSRDNVCLGANRVKFNNGVTEYFKKFQSSKTGVKHYIVTSGIKYYVDETEISGIVDGIYGVTFIERDNILQNIDVLLTDEKKVDIIKKLQNKNNETNQIIYFGDGLTDKFAFEYVHNIGGKNVFIASNKKSMDNFQKLNVNGIIDEYFEADFGIDSKINEYIQSQILAEKM